jgi:release factor glutamine methyltransferase
MGLKRCDLIDAGGAHVQELNELIETLSSRITFLPDKPEETAESTAKALWLASTGQPCSVALALTRPLPDLDSKSRARLDELVTKRFAGVPLAHLTERQSFLDIELLAGPQALIPRKETEIVGRAALTKLQEFAKSRGNLRVVDVCTGSGNLAVALAVHVSECEVWGLDLSSDAVKLAERNAALHHVSNRVSFRQGDLLAPIATDEFWGHCDLLVCNPPYISSAKVSDLPSETGSHEPHLAFDGGNFGVTVISRLLKEAPRFLRPASWLCFEVGLGQGPYFARSLGKISEYRFIETYSDQQGNVRALAAMTA